MEDPVINSIKNNKIVFWEEIARDGAQAKTILNTDQRIKVVSNHCKMFGKHAKDHLVFAVGFPTICQSEYDTIQKLVNTVSECSMVTHGRTTKTDVDKSFEVMKNAAYPRVSFFFPVSEIMSQRLMKRTPVQVLEKSLETLKYAVDKSNGVPIDIALADAGRANLSHLEEVIGRLHETGIYVAKLCDSIGSMFPAEVAQMCNHVMKNKPEEMYIGCHMHNDFGFAQINNFEAIRSGIRLLASSWLGLAERNGLQPTEQLLFLLANKKLNTLKRLNIEGADDFFYKEPNLKFLYPTCKKISEYTSYTMNMTHGIVGPGVNSLSTGTPFTDPETFRPFDPDEDLGIPPKVFVTHLASNKLIEYIASSLGYKDLDVNILNEVMSYVKSEPYRRSSPIIDEDEIREVVEWKKMEFDEKKEG